VANPVLADSLTESGCICDSGALTKRALVDGDCESFSFQRRWRADLGKSAADVAISESGLPPCDMAHFPP